ncbi:relaxase/mobilization nuclease domain-containing protein [Sinanaerobacter sp. ZZT-01]|uniref:relaxase/mobilization nuclease domain-containing protein n=1 Tax=Sinanaerobacter sp. ZZT-01 TaxID=3111540 RepID=UPI002D76DF23|nr:relaxase/mobilization nuclease domain-containing protein [Sinanaerobacter sp. ZZT-01]WRR94245.1 relaxase/mobilization nuclease domain-containing protein [Sinanaerobacter sp. ZZT-01]
MAITKIWDVKVRPDQRLEYVSRPEKSDNGTLLFSNRCSTDWELAHLQMQTHRRRFNKDNNNLIYHGCVSFPAKEVSPEQAREIAIEWMNGKFSRYQYFGSVHVDTKNIHFNFIFNAVDMDGKKYNDCNRTLDELRAWTDTLCEKYGLEVVIPKDKGMSYKEYMERRNQSSWKANIQRDIDATIWRSDSFEHFIELMHAQGYFIKYGENVTHIVFKKEGMEKGCRGRKIGAAYTEEMIKERIRFKEFCFIPSGIEWHSKWKKLTPSQKAFWGLKHRRARFSTLFGLWLHAMSGTKEFHLKKVSPSQRKGYKSKYEYQIKELTEQLFFVQKNNISSRSDVNERLVFLMEQLNRTTDWKQKKEIEKEMGPYQKLLKNLNKIRERTIIPDVNFDRSSQEEMSSKSSKVKHTDRRL